MTTIFVFDIEKLSPPQVSLLELMVGQLPAELYQGLVLRTEDEKVDQALVTITAGWPRMRMVIQGEVLPVGSNLVEAAPVEPKTRKARKIHTPTGDCAKCGKAAVLVVASGLCKPCHMAAVRERKALVAEGVLPSPESVRQSMGLAAPVVDRIAERVEARNARESAAVGRVVAQARERGTLGANVEKTAMGFSANGGSGIHCRKVG
jgi:hypothetical protein